MRSPDYFSQIRLSQYIDIVLAKKAVSVAKASIIFEKKSFIKYSVTIVKIICPQRLSMVTDFFSHKDVFVETSIPAIYIETMSSNRLYSAKQPWRSKLHEVIFEADTMAGRAFDLILILSIALSVSAVLLDSITSVNYTWGTKLYFAEWIFTILFTIEYILRIVSVKNPSRYIFSFFGLVDLLAILPTYISLIFPGSQYLLVIRILRVLRIFRVLKLATYIGEAKLLTTALRHSRRKITVFLFTVITMVIILGSLMYMIEGEKSGFTSIPQSVYWAIVTLTTVGYGDISPITPLGKVLAAVIMILGYGIIAVPTGIVTVELSRVATGKVTTKACESCGGEGHDSDAVYCKHCGVKL